MMSSLSLSAPGLPIITPEFSCTNNVLPVMPSGKIVQIVNQQCINGDNDIFTVPQGKRASFVGVIVNQSGATCTIVQKLKINGNYVQVAASVTVSNNANIGVIAFNTTPIAEAGETISINFNQVVQLFGYVIMFNFTDGVLSPKLTSLQTGDNILYQCPQGKYAFLTNCANTGNAPIRTINNSGATRTYKVNVVPSGGSPSSNNLLTFPFTTANGAQTSSQIPSLVGLGPGDYINLNVDVGTATQFAWIVNVVEQFI